VPNAIERLSLIGLNRQPALPLDQLATHPRRAFPVIVALALSACAVATPSTAPASESTATTLAETPTPAGTLSGDRQGLVLQAEMHATADSVVIEIVVRNTRSELVHLASDQCGRVTEARLVRTQFEPEGDRWAGSVQAVKDLILDDQLSRQAPDRFHPRVPGDASDQTPDCNRPERPIPLAPGDEIAERWELPLDSATVLDEVGSDASVVRLEVVEARSPDELEFIDVYQDRFADEEREGRNLRIEEPAESVVRQAPTAEQGRLSLGELFDRLIVNEELRGWIEAQPADSWVLANLTPAYPEFDDPELAHVQLRVVTTEYERAARVEAEPDGSEATVELPGADTRTRDFARRPGTIPPGIDPIDEPESFALTEDLVLPDVVLPTGRVVVGEYLLTPEEWAVDLTLAPGRYPVHATLARYPDRNFDSVALATLVVSTEPIVRWEEAGVVAVDGGSTTIVSVEGAQALIELIERDEAEWLAFNEEDMFESLAAHDYLATEVAIDGVNLAHFTSGVGDGGYPVFVGYDAADRPTRIVVDFLLLHLDWPGAPE
jgi:uncharacterized protein DUF4241